MKKLFTDRSRIETQQACPRRRYYEYELDGRGVVSARKALPLAVGGAVHEGLAVLLRQAQFDVLAHSLELDEARLRAIEENAVQTALADFAEYAGGALELDVNERGAMLVAAGGGNALDDIAGVGAESVVADVPLATRSDFDEYLYKEQSALVEAMVRAYAKRRLRPLLEQFEVLEVEREGMWELARWQDAGTYVRVDCVDKCGHWHGSSFDKEHPWPQTCPGCNGPVIVGKWAYQLNFMSRPDALLLDRASRELYLLSFKTTASWDVRRARDAEHDMQGLSEGVEVERRLAHWWELIHDGMEENRAQGRQVIDFTYLRDTLGCIGVMFAFLADAPAPPRIHAIRYEYLLKGQRDMRSRCAKELSTRMGFECRVQSSPLVYAWVNDGMTVADTRLAHSFAYVNADGEEKRLSGKVWYQRPAWEQVTTREWIDGLDSRAVQPEAQGDILADQFLAPIVIYRQEDELRDWLEQVEAQERRVAEASAEVAACADEGERRRLLNVHFVQNRHSCEFPSTCAYAKLCWGGDDIRRDPVGSGLYSIRVPNHPMEAGE